MMLFTNCQSVKICVSFLSAPFSRLESDSVQNMKFFLIFSMLHIFLFIHSRSFLAISSQINHIEIIGLNNLTLGYFFFDEAKNDINLNYSVNLM